MSSGKTESRFPILTRGKSVGGGLCRRSARQSQKVLRSEDLDSFKNFKG